MILFALLLVLTHSAIEFDYSVSLIPHPKKAKIGGQDAYYVNRRLLIVADGVGGWRQRGINSGIFSASLCKNGEMFFKNSSEYYSKNPKQLIKICHLHNNYEGSSTMVVLTIDQSNNLLRTSYIGDSRYIIIRNRSIIFEAKQQLYSFNFPYQLASPSSKNGTDPSKSIQNSHNIRNYDIIVVGSDGLFDNIFPHDILHVVNRIGHYDGKFLQNKQDIAEYLCSLAIITGKNRKCISPFSVNARKYRKQWRGGKLDDTTVIISQIIIQNQSQQEQSDNSESSIDDQSVDEEDSESF